MIIAPRPSDSGSIDKLENKEFFRMTNGTPTRRVVGYLRDSDELCSRTSIEDQMPVASGYAVRQLGSEIMKFYVDEDISGQTLGGRHAYAQMLADAEKGKFDVVVAEAIDRLARRTADVTDLRDMLAYHGVELHVANIGLVTPLHAAMMGMVAEQFSRDLASKTKRGQRGAVSRGKVSNGIAYGYQKCDSAPSGRIIVPEQAAVVVRIFEEFAQGVAPPEIADHLNRDGIVGPRGGFWRDDTIRGEVARGSGILRNELYNGEIVYGRANHQESQDRQEALEEGGGTYSYLGAGATYRPARPLGTRPSPSF